MFRNQILFRISKLIGGNRTLFRISGIIYTGKRPLGRPRRRWEDNVRMNIEEIGINAVNQVDSAQDRDY